MRAVLASFGRLSLFHRSPMLGLGLVPIGASHRAWRLVHISCLYTVRRVAVGWSRIEPRWRLRLLSMHFPNISRILLVGGVARLVVASCVTGPMGRRVLWPLLRLLAVEAIAVTLSGQPMASPVVFYVYGPRDSWQRGVGSRPIPELGRHPPRSALLLSNVAWNSARQERNIARPPIVSLFFLFVEFRLFGNAILHFGVWLD